MRCSCGQVYHADPAHAGRSLRCRCGHAVSIPAAEPRPNPSSSPGSTAPPRARKSRTRRRRSASPARVRWPRLHAPTWLARWLPRAAWGYLALCLAAAAILWTEGDRWWLATVLLFGPRWLLLLPAIPIGLAALLTRPRLLIPMAGALVVSLGPVMGFRTGWRGLLPGAPPRALRVITFNVQGEANPLLMAVPAALVRLGADVIVLQECPARMAEAALWPEGWTARSPIGGLCLASRFPVAETKVLERLEAGLAGGTGNAAVFRLYTNPDTVDLVDLHLETPRKGLAPLRRGGTADRLELNTEVRDVGARRISRWRDTETKDPIIAGDFNMPVESRIYRAYFADCRNAFSHAGRGFGATRILNRFSVRIDHVLACGAWRPLKAEVGPDLGSDHLPLIVDLGRTR